MIDFGCSSPNAGTCCLASEELDLIVLTFVLHRSIISRYRLLAGEEFSWEVPQLALPEESAKREMIKSVVPRREVLAGEGLGRSGRLVFGPLPE